jgi:hypothetical protein
VQTNIMCKFYYDYLLLVVLNNNFDTSVMKITDCGGRFEKLNF